jgi:hypothetical protein
MGIKHFKSNIKKITTIITTNQNLKNIISQMQYPKLGNSKGETKLRLLMIIRKLEVQKVPHRKPSSFRLYLLLEISVLKLLNYL